MLKRLLYFVICIILLGAFAGCQESAEEFAYIGGSGTTVANVSGGGQWAYDNGFIYFAEAYCIYEYDLETGKTVTFDMGTEIPNYLFLSGDYICYVDTMNPYTLRCISKDGKNKTTVFERNAAMSYVFADGMDLYFYSYSSDGVDLYCRNMQNGEETHLMSSVSEYYVDEQYIYTLVLEGEEVSLYRSEREEIQFEKLEITLPRGVFYADNDRVVASRRVEIAEKTWENRVFLYENGEEKQLPVYASFGQVLDNWLICLDEGEADSFRTLKAYNLENGETKLLGNNSNGFGILEQRYICFSYIPEDGKKCYMLYDWQTGETLELPQ